MSPLQFPMSSRLYAHAQHSILAFCTFSELATVIRLNHSWNAAVGSCPSLRADVWVSDSFAGFGNTGLLRHVASITDIKSQSGVAVHANELSGASQRLSSLQSASFFLIGTLPRQWFLPPALTRLHLAFLDKFTVVAHNLVIEAMGRLPALVGLTLTVPLALELTFAPLAQLKHLRILTLLSPLPQRFSYRLHDSHVAQIRLLEWLETLVISQLPLSLCRLLAPPHAMRWSCLDEPTRLHIDTAGGGVHSLGEVLAQLKTITSVNGFHFGDGGARWIESMPALRLLRLRFRDLPPAHAGLMEALTTCSQLEELTLQRFQLTAAHFETVVSRLMNLRFLDLQDGMCLDSLSFMAHPNLANSLESFRLGPRTGLPATEIPHLFGLKRLRRLNLHGWSVQCKLDPAVRALLIPPSAMLPELNEFLYFL